MENCQNVSDSDKIDLIVAACNRLADILKDPTDGGKKDLSADSRNSCREDAYDDLLICIDVLAASAQFNHGFFDVINIASKHKIEHNGKL